MKKLEFKRIGLLIGVTLLITLSIQVWRMASQWDILQAELKQDIQQNLDHAVENYFADLAKSDVFALTDADYSFSAEDSVTSSHIRAQNDFAKNQPSYLRLKEQIHHRLP